MKCPNCGQEQAPGAVFCDNCGARMTAAAEAQSAAPAAEAQPAAAPAQPAASNALLCPQCGAHYTPGEAFCDQCGAALPSPAPAVAVPAQEQAAAAPATQPAPSPQPAALAPQPPAPAAQPAPQVAPAPVAQPTPAQPSPAQPGPARPVAGTCPQCGNPVAVGQAFCDNCGASLAGVRPATNVAPPIQVPLQPGPIAGPRLVVTASGAQIPLTGKTEFLIGREDPVSNIFPDIDMTPHGGDVGGVSRRHARLGLQGNQGWIEDLNSVNGTWVNKQRVPANQRQALTPGSEIRIGRVVLQFQV